MNNRKYFKYKIVELEAVYEEAGGDCAVLEELEEELSHRSTPRAKKLLLKYKNIHGDDAEQAQEVIQTSHKKQEPAANQNSEADEEVSIDWKLITQAPNKFGKVRRHSFKRIYQQPARYT